MNDLIDGAYNESRLCIPVKKLSKVIDLANKYKLYYTYWEEDGTSDMEIRIYIYNNDEEVVEEFNKNFCTDENFNNYDYVIFYEKDK